MRRNLGVEFMKTGDSNYKEEIHLITKEIQSDKIQHNNKSEKYNCHTRDKELIPLICKVFKTNFKKTK